MMAFCRPIAGAPLILFLATGAAVRAPPRFESVAVRDTRQPYTAALIVPTGIGAAMGGYAGDAMPIARAFTAVADRVITHPNVLNGATMYWPHDAFQYVEGFALDEFAAGRWGLRPAVSQRIGLLLDAGIEPELRLRHLQAADAARATLGVCVSAHATTDEPIGVEIQMSPAGASWGTLRRPDALLRAAKRLQAAGCTAIAVVARFPDKDDEMLAAYVSGSGVDAIGGAEAIISHLITKELGIPCAHAPAVRVSGLQDNVAPRVCAEELGHTFLPCVLVNLSRAPRLLDGSERPQPGDIWRDDLDALVAPIGACGGAAVLALLRSRVLIVAVEENTSAMDVFPEAVAGPGEIVRVRSYMEAIGLLAAHRAGVNAACLTTNIAPMRDLEAP